MMLLQIIGRKIKIGFPSILFCLYKGESVSRSQFIIKRKTFDIRTWEKYLFLDISSTNICPIALPVLRNQQHRSLLTVVSATSAFARAPCATFERP
jgi:hypothetical protein